jgi:hypothetical protein
LAYNSPHVVFGIVNFFLFGKTHTHAKGSEERKWKRKKRKRGTEGGEEARR